MKNSLKKTCVMAMCALFSGAAWASDVTFLFGTDTHYGVGTDDSLKTSFVNVMNALPGTAYPASVGGVVDTPRGVCLTGDLINDGGNVSIYRNQWKAFTADYGVNGEGLCRFPVYEGMGNHDLTVIWDSIRVRNRLRKNIADTSPNGYHYSWDWDGVHFIQLNLFPGNVWDPLQQANSSVHAPRYARDFLVSDLAKHVGTSGRPVVVMWHFSTTSGWWYERPKQDVYKILSGYNVILILTGHEADPNGWRGIPSDNGNDIVGTGVHVVHITPGDSLYIFRRTSLTAWNPAFSYKVKFYPSYAASGRAAVVSNGNLVSSITPDGNVTASGKLLYEAVSPTALSLYYGTVDGDTVRSRWQDSVKITNAAAIDSAYSGTLTGIKVNQNYFYRCYGSNANGHAWSGYSVPFTGMNIYLPKTAERLQAGANFWIRWNSYNIVLGIDSVKIEYSATGTSWETVAPAAGNTGAWNWIIPAAATPSTQARIRITTKINGFCDTSDVFTMLPSSGIAAPRLTMRSSANVSVQMTSRCNLTIHADFDILQAHILDCAGKLVSRTDAHGSSVAFAGQRFGPGVYIVKITGRHRVVVANVVVP